MADNAAIARPYAQAIFELARDSGQLAGWADWLQAAGVAVDDASVEQLIGAPSTDEAALIRMIGDVANQASGTTPGDHATNVLRLLAENDRLTALPEIATAFAALKADVENRVEVTLTAASPVDELQQAKIIEALKRRFGRDVSLSFKLDESLIGGARLRADDLVIDGSVQTGLAKLATALAN